MIRVQMANHESNEFVPLETIPRFKQRLELGWIDLVETNTSSSQPWAQVLKRIPGNAFRGAEEHKKVTKEKSSTKDRLSSKDQSYPVALKM
jgi:hypothetical protein